MDRFKFRVWREEEKRFIESDCGSPLVISLDGDLCDSYDYLDYNGFGIVEQCTGLKDKNGKLIYEGDIVKNHRGEIGEVYWVEENAQFALRNKHYEDVFVDGVFSLLDKEEMEDFEVISNIHENKSNI